MADHQVNPPESPADPWLPRALIASVAAALLFANAERRTEDPNTPASSYDHGWPMTSMFRQPADRKAPPGALRLGGPHERIGPQSKTVVRFSGAGLAVNMLVALAVLAAAEQVASRWLAERKRTLRGRFQFSLAAGLLLTLFVAVELGLVSTDSRFLHGFVRLFAWSLLPVLWLGVALTALLPLLAFAEVLRRPAVRRFAVRFAVVAAVAASLLAVNLCGIAEPVPGGVMVPAPAQVSRGRGRPPRVPAVRSGYRWRHGWPLTHTRRIARFWRRDSGSDGPSFRLEATSPWVTPWSPAGLSPGGFDVTALCLDVAIAAVLLVGTGFVVGRGHLQQAVRRPRGVAALVLFGTPVVAMAVAAWGFDLLPWPLLGVVWFGVGCTVYAGGLLAVRAAGPLRVRRRSTTPEEAE